MGLQENLRTEPVNRLALREAIKAPAETSIRQAIDLMRAKRLGCLIVVDPEDKPVGTFTEAALIDLLVQNPALVDTDQVGQHLDKVWACVKESEPIAAMVDAMREKDLRFVCVVDEQGKVKALTGQKGLVEYVAEHFPRQSMVQRVGGKPFLKEREGA